VLALTPENVRRNLDLLVAEAIELTDGFDHVVIVWETFGHKETWRGYLAHGPVTARPLLGNPRFRGG
jgi:hypothetical protein